ncbi:hypothetical protein [Streptomyces sp. AV19]|uniref:hypothetical protein n=1 Tax=Streptomyces sp. AV19 TaxID=2793068 RepID=UPI002413A868|nr:hypothetical protein [Streptomyces sp. AV19]MDG4531626.1 hypothetical protein [Streptomyces sp. AV19]
MANWTDLTEDNGFNRLAQTHRYIAAACALLPLPVHIQPIRNGARIGDVIDDIARVAKIIDENPLPEAVQASVFTSCTYWLAAVEVFANYLASPAEYRANAFAMLILDSELSLKMATEWLASEANDEIDNG